MAKPSTSIPLTVIDQQPTSSQSQSPSPSPTHDHVLSPYLPPALLVFCANNTGLLYVAAAQLFFALMNLTVKYFLSVTSVSVLTLIDVRMIITASGCVMALYLMGDEHYFLGPPAIRPMLALRGFFGFAGLLGAYQSFKGLSVSDSLTISYLSPSVTAILGYVLLKESLSRRELLAGVYCLGGVLLVSRPPFIFGAGTPSTVPPSEVPMPGEGGDADVSTPARMIAVGWAISTVFSSAIACTCTVYRFWIAFLMQTL